MNLRRFTAVSLVSVVLAGGVWIVCGNAWAARKEERCDRAWAATFGSLDDLKKKYPRRETNETARELEELTRGGVAAHAGHGDASARSLEASWSLNESLRARPETMASLIGIAIGRLQVGVLRKVNVEEDLWRKRLATLDPRNSLVDRIVVENPAKLYRWSRWSRWSALKKDGDRSWFRPALDFLGGPWYRMEMADYSDLIRVELVRLRSTPLSDRSPESANSKGSGLAHTLTSMAISNIRSTFLRADRLVVDAELTSKILEAKRGLTRQRPDVDRVQP